MVEPELTHVLISRLEQLGLNYFVTGSVGAAAYGYYRSTLDIDVVVVLFQGHVKRFCEAFAKPDFIVDEYSVRQAIDCDGMFTMIYLPSAEKVDVILPKDTDYNESRFDRRRRIELPTGVTASVACPEHIILSKMEFYQMGGSEKHISDITGIFQMNVVEIDRSYIEMMAMRMGTSGVWNMITQKLRGEGYQ